MYIVKLLQTYKISYLFIGLLFTYAIGLLVQCLHSLQAYIVSVIRLFFQTLSFVVGLSVTSTMLLVLCLIKFIRVVDCADFLNQVSLPMVQDLARPAMRERHWKQLMEATGKIFNMDEKFCLGDLLALELHKF